MISIVKRGPGQWGFEIYWPKEIELIVTLTLTDPDDQVDERTVNWMSSQDTPLATVLQTLTGEIEALPHWRARRAGSQLLITPASEDYTGAVSFNAVVGGT